MACRICEHCATAVSGHDGETLNGYSYHKKCHKCYVCSETDLQNAEVFKGVIFCSSCSQRIFQGCSIARGTKNTSRVPKHHQSSRRRHDRSSRRQKKTEPITPGVIELARLAGSVVSSSSEERKNNRSRKPLESIKLASQVRNEVYLAHDNIENMELGMTTDVTEELLRQINCPVVTAAVSCKRRHKPQSRNTKNRYRGDERYKRPVVCSDLRIAELGASTEIASMALRKKSEQPIIINSQSHLKNAISHTLSALNQESDLSEDTRDWVKLSDRNSRTRWTEKRIGSLLKLPYKYFKRNILHRSSLISVLTKIEDDLPPLVKFKMLFREDIVEHQDRGIQQLYRTINNRRVPHRMGWLKLVSNVPRQTQDPLATRCKHMNKSHSYRCMRHHVMRLAGPTRSELAAIRKKIRGFIVPTPLGTCKIINFNRILKGTVTQACGVSVHESKCNDTANRTPKQ